MPSRIRWNTSRRRHFVVCGDNPLAHRLADELRGEKTPSDVTVVLRSKRRYHGPQISALDDVRVVEADALTTEALHAARVDTADAVALVEQNDLGNLHSAMLLHELYPQLRLVVRMFDRRLGKYLSSVLEGCTVLSDSAVAAPWFVADALQQLTPNHVRVADRTLRITTRNRAGGSRVACSLATFSTPGSPTLLPVEERPSDLVLIEADGTPSEPLSRRRLSWWNQTLGRLPALAGSRLTWFLVVFFALLAVVAVCYIVVGYPPSNAIYLTILDAAGAANPDVHRGALEKVIQSITAVVGISLIPVLTATVVDAVVGGRISDALGRMRRTRNHVVIVGLGEVGSRVLQQLHDLGIQAVCVDLNADARGVRLARRLGVPVILGDVTDEETLRAASVGSCRALLAVTSDDVTNLQAGLSARDIRRDLPVGLRLFDADFAARVQNSFDTAISSRSVSYLAAPSFAVAMQERQVIDTIAVGRSVLLIAEIPVVAGSALEGATRTEIEAMGEVRVLATFAPGEEKARFDLPRPYVLRESERLIVLATGNGLARVVEGSFATPDRPPHDRAAVQRHT